VIAVFKQKSPGNVAVLFIFGLLLKLPVFIYPKPIVTTVNDGRLYHWFVNALPQNSNLLYSTIAFLLLYSQSLMVNYLMNEYKMMTRQNYLPAMAYLLITSLLPEWNYLSSPLVSSTLIIWTFIYLFKLYNAPNAKAHVYNIGLIAGINSYIYFPSFVFVVCILLGLMILKPFHFNEIVLFILGCLTPYYFFWLYLFLTDALNFRNFVPLVSIKIPIIKDSIWIALSTLLLTVPFLMGGYYVQTNLRKMLIQVRKNWSIVLLYLLLSFFVPFINSDQSFHTWVLVTAPFAAFHACTYFYGKRWLALILFFITLIYILYLQYGTLIWR
jgi:hypothetical protein